MDKSGTLTCIDPYVVTEAGMQGSLAISKMVIGRIQRGHVRFIRDFSRSAAKTWSEPLDFLFIDGDHTEAACRLDFEDWERFVQPGGVILFHDSRLDQPPVQELMGAVGSTEVVKKLFRLQKHPHWRIVDEGGSIVVIQRA
jgi:predicted O-methyltransferase YrrM